MVSLKSQIDESRVKALEGMDLPWLLNEWVQRQPQKDFMIWEPFSGAAEHYSYSRVQDEARIVAASLENLGVEQGDFVIIHLDNSPEFVVSWFACAELGAIAVSTNCLLYTSPSPRDS